MSLVPLNYVHASSLGLPKQIEECLSIYCPLTRKIMREPVQDKHGHCFERSAIEEWLGNHSQCPLNQKSLGLADLKPHDLLNKRITSLQQAESNPEGEMPAFSEENRDLAEPLLKRAQELEQKAEEAEKIYFKALKYTSRSEDYAQFVRFLETRNTPLRTARAYLYLAELQNREDKFQGCEESLKRSLELAPNSIVRKQMALFLLRIQKNAEAAFLFLELAEQAHFKNDLETAIMICQQAFNAFRGISAVWKMMSCLSNDASEAQKALFLGAQESLIPLKERKILCQWILLKDSNNLPVRIVYLSVKLDLSKEKNKCMQNKFAQIQSAQMAQIYSLLIEEKVKRLIDSLWSSSYAVRDRSSMELAQIGAPAIPSVIGALKYNAKVDGHFARLNKQQPNWKSPPCQWVDTNINDKSWSMLQAAWHALVEMAKNPSVVPSLKNALGVLMEDMQERGLKLDSLNADYNQRVYTLAKSLV